MAENKDIESKGRKEAGGIVGTFRHSLDPKKRLTIPSEWRDAMGDPEYVYVFPDMTKDCLNLAPPHEMASLLEKMKSDSLFDADADALREAFGETAQMIRIDSAGRIRINDDLLGFAGVNSAVVLKGAVRNAKIWAAEKLPAAGAGGKRFDVAAARAAMAKFRMMGV